MSGRELAANVALTFLVLCAVVFGYLGIGTFADMVTKDVTRMVAKDAEAVTVRRDGMPLDSLTYDAPVWLDGCTGARKIVDRVSGASWWVLTIGEGVYTQYIVLPIGKEAQ